MLNFKEVDNFLSENKKVVKYRKPFNINIGVIIFIIIFIYLIFNVFSYMTATHISVYEVQQGTMAENNVYKGLILREEQVYYANYTGAVNFYVKEASRVSANNLVYSIDENGDISQKIQEASQDVSVLESSDLSEIEESIFDFQSSYDAQTFYNVYAFKENIDSALNEALSLKALNSLSDYTASAEASNTFHLISSDQPGIVVYYSDGYEGITTETFTTDMFDESSYSRTNSQNSLDVTSGAPVYKLITSEYWNIILPIPQDVADELADDDTLQLRFVQDDKKTYATYTIQQRNGQNYLVLTLRNSMIRYAKDRYIEVELLLAEETGLKIPNSAITEKEFYTVPIEYFMKGGDSSQEGLLIQRKDKDNNTITEFVAPTIYYETEAYYYIDSEDVSADDIILKPDSASTYTVGSNTDVLKGVYNINKGYAVFKQIDILYQNEEYSIVETGTTYGIALYDHIALDGTKIQENELIK